MRASHKHGANELAEQLFIQRGPLGSAAEIASKRYVVRSEPNVVAKAGLAK
jgi:hypothetical protein